MIATLLLQDMSVRYLSAVTDLLFYLLLLSFHHQVAARPPVTLAEFPFKNSSSSLARLNQSELSYLGSEGMSTRLGENTEFFAYPIPDSSPPRSMTGLLDKDHSIDPLAMVRTIRDGIKLIRKRIFVLGDRRLEMQTYKYERQGCELEVESAISGDRVIMTYRMLLEVHQALYTMLSYRKQEYETLFALSSDDGNTVS